MTESMERGGLEKRLQNELVMKEGKARFVEELARSIRAMDELIDRMERAFDDGLPERFYRYVHTLKGSAPIFGFASVGSVAEALANEWEWTQDEAERGAAYEPAARRSVLNSRASLLQMKMELLILQRQQQQAGPNDQGQRNAVSGSSGKLLVVDDDDVLRSFLVRRFELDGYVVHDANTVELAKRMLHEDVYDLILLDLMMHPQSGYELFDHLKEDPTFRWIPLIVLSARNDVHDKVRCLMLGANDYVTKPFQYEELAARVYSLLARTRNFEQLAFRDPLTGVFNRRYFDHQIELELHRTVRFPAPISIAFIDIDRFKTINDSYGHAIGDLVLQGLAHLLQQHLRATDVLARYGGEEFVVVLPNASGGQAVRQMEEALAATRRQPIVQHEGQSFSITFSCGVAEWTPGLPTAQWIALADEAMYRAKQQGRDRVLLADGAPETAASRRPENELTPAKRVLVADDDGILRSILATRLKKMGVRVAEAQDGEEALAHLSGNGVDLCILDGVMPKLDGFELLRRMKADPEERFRTTRVLMLSGKKRDEDISLALRLGADEYMSKPFSLVDLDMRVKRLLELDA
ncbi:response regulator [Paenibacillus flagellatus]|uniref:Diguanylate cyclase n=1 Tax=Paenibacillus flagellatus TaxID=2211139 RepID=A0A2V5K1J4_9BACL|nr:response regulator [Paenibacillus flagellatus]PYI53105.1 diguanylate cyclase [Paenibacillus flagellatus]